MPSDLTSILAVIDPLAASLVVDVLIFTSVHSIRLLRLRSLRIFTAVDKPLSRRRGPGETLSTGCRRCYIPVKTSVVSEQSGLTPLAAPLWPVDSEYRGLVPPAGPEETRPSDMLRTRASCASPTKHGGRSAGSQRMGLRRRRPGQCPGSPVARCPVWSRHYSQWRQTWCCACLSVRQRRPLSSDGEVTAWCSYVKLRR